MTHDPSPTDVTYEILPIVDSSLGQLALIDFLRLFTHAEIVAFNALRRRVAAMVPADYSDPAMVDLIKFEVGLTHYDALREGRIELSHPETIDWVGLLVPLNALTAERLPRVLAGLPPEVEP